MSRPILSLFDHYDQVAHLVHHAANGRRVFALDHLVQFPQPQPAHSLAHVPVLAVVGRKEAETRTVALRRLGSQAQELLSLEEAVARLASEAAPPDLRTGNVA